MRATIKDVAKHANTSTATVSRYINGKPITEVNRKNIENAIEELNFEINANARGLKTNSTMTIGVIIPQLNHIYDITIVKGIQNYLIKHGYSLMILESNSDYSVEEKCLELLQRKHVDGIILNSDSRDLKLVSNFEKIKIPVVLIDQKIDNIPSNVVLADNINAVYQATEYLIKMGHKKISIILGQEISFTAQERLLGYVRAMQDYSIEMNPDYIKYSNYKTDGGYNSMYELLALAEKPTSVIVSNYDMTHGALRALNEKNINIPDDISFIGYDDSNLAEIYKPRMTIIMQPMIEMGEKAASLILKMVKNQTEMDSQVYRLKTTFLRNDSVRRI